MSNASISGSWEKIKLLCGNHEEPIEMVIHQGGASLFYSCPKYYPDNRTEDEKVCINRLSLKDFETKLLGHINDLIVSAEINGEVLNLKHHKWKANGIEFEILEHTDDKIVVKMLNRKALSDIKRY